jgi:hypothetical protein
LTRVCTICCFDQWFTVEVDTFIVTQLAFHLVQPLLKLLVTVWVTQCKVNFLSFSVKLLFEMHLKFVVAGVNLHWTFKTGPLLPLYSTDWTIQLWRLGDWPKHVEVLDDELDNAFWKAHH